MRSTGLLVGALALLVVLPGCTVISDCRGAVGNACGSVWSACTGVFDGGGGNRAPSDGNTVPYADDTLAAGDPVYDTATQPDAAPDEDRATRGHGAFRMP